MVEESINLEVRLKNIEEIRMCQPAHNIPRALPYGSILFETSRTNIGPK